MDVLFRFVVDLRVPEILPAVQPSQVFSRSASAFRRPLCEGRTVCTWTLELREPEIIWDTLVAERALNLGRFRVRTESNNDESESDAIRSRELERVSGA